MRLTASRYRQIMRDISSDVAVALDDARVRALQRTCERTAGLVAHERARLRRLGEHEQRARRRGFQVVAGVDEVGRGPLAGPLVAAAVVFDRPPWIPLLDDSKKLAEDVREDLFDLICVRARACSLGVIEVDELNGSNLHQASLEAMRRAVVGLDVAIDLVLVDGCHEVTALPCAQQTLVKGDALSVSIAAASILAKVTRDRIMRTLDARWPQYGFAQNKGYGTAEHLEALTRFGPSPAHRLGFAPVARLADAQLRLWDEGP